MSTADRHIAHARAQIAAARGSEPATLNPALARYSVDPVMFAREVLGIEPWSRQAEVMAAMATSRRVAVRSGRKVGKSTLAAAVALWWVTTRVGGRVVLSAPTSRQVRSILWRELTRLYRASLLPIGGTLHMTPEMGLQFEDGREVVGFATDTPERFAGLSGDELLFIFDEASGVAEQIFDVALGNLAGGGAMFLASNPTRPDGTFAAAFGRKEKFWRTFHISSLESPNVVAGRKLVAGLATSEWATDMADEWGESGPLYEVHVLGNFATEAANAVIGLALVAAAQQRWFSLMGGGGPSDLASLGPLEIGVDPARFGDDESVIFPRRGSVALEPLVYRKLDGVELAERVVEAAVRLRVGAEVPVVRVDSIGIGASVVDQLSRSRLVTTVPVNVGEAATVPTYSRKRDEVWFQLRDWLRAGGAIPPDPRLELELVGPTYSIGPNGRAVVESKDSMKQRIKRSPDRADALALAVYTVQELSTAQLWIRAGKPETGAISADSYAKPGNAPGIGFGALFARRR